ncbi:sigma-54-dependent Fis family transcriptional regulator [Alcaligenaceae bacterium CGII-47]|nr:sigma-54-dependent Fis family transcriptional regulator [Alcaligenaceae bacterium CGII-47]
MATPPTLQLSARSLASRSQSTASIIERSWQRCAGLDPTALRDPNPMRLADLNIRREAQHTLLTHAQPSIAALGTLAGAARSLVLLADASGLILHESGAKAFLSKARRVALQPGVNWAESSRGTNAIGTALFDGRAVGVHGTEHFLSCNRILSCHAAPIFSGKGDILGVLDLSGPAKDPQGYALGLVQMYAKQISNRLLRDSPLRQLVFQTDSTESEDPYQGILLIDERQNIAGANEAALQLLATDWQLIGTPVNQWFEGALALGNDPERLRRHDGKLFAATLYVPNSPTSIAKPVHTQANALPSPLGQPHLEACMQELIAPAVRAINTGLAVLLQGETGTGKEVVARHIHAQSHWHAGSFIPINCGALPESLVESELFGYAAGAFTGARREGARGLLQQAHKGVVFLDEIGDMPLLLQTRLLRVLQEREVQPLGSEKRIPLEFGLISASHRNLKSMVAGGTFRADLYYRLQDMHITLPALRTRRDLPELLHEHFTRPDSVHLSDDAIALLIRYAWPGNYRELHSILRRLRCQYPSERLIQAHMLPVEIQAQPLDQTDARVNECDADQIPAISAHPGPVVATPDTDLRALELSAIKRAMAAHQGNVSLAAQALGVHRSTLYRRLNRQGQR